MNAKKTPLQQVNEEHGGKAKLVDKVLGLVERGEEGAGELKTRLLKASNKKLLRLMATSAAIKDKYGSADKLAEAVGQKLNRLKDKDYMSRLSAYTPAKLLDLARSLSGERRRPLKVSAAAPSEKKAAAKKAAAAKKSAHKIKSKKPAAKKPAKKPVKKSSKS